MNPSVTLAVTVDVDSSDVRSARRGSLPYGCRDQSTAVLDFPGQTHIDRIDMGDGIAHGVVNRTLPGEIPVTWSTSRG